MPANESSPFFFTTSAAPGFTIGSAESQTSESEFLTPLRRDLLVTAPGPDAGGSKPGREGCHHRPEKSGMDAVPCVPSLAAPTGALCPNTGVAEVAANVT